MNNKSSLLLIENKSVTTSSFLVVAVLEPLPPLFCVVYSFSSTDLIKPSDVIVTTNGSSFIRSSSVISLEILVSILVLLSSPNSFFNSVNSLDKTSKLYVSSSKILLYSSILSCKSLYSSSNLSIFCLIKLLNFVSRI